jgi:hypothetical protein
MTEAEAQHHLAHIILHMYEGMFKVEDMEVIDERGVWLTPVCPGDGCRWWLSPHAPMRHRLVYFEPHRPTDMFRSWNAYQAHVGKCRTCGGRTHLVDETEHLVFHYPGDITEREPITVTYADCRKCGRDRHFP